MTNFWDSSVWGFVNLFAVLLVSLLAANALKRAFRFLEASLIPTSVLAGAMLLLVSELVRALDTVKSNLDELAVKFSLPSYVTFTLYLPAANS